MIQLDEKKLARLRTTNQQLNEKYGEHGTDTREKFNEKSMAWYYGDILRERRKELKLTQKQLAQKIGKEQSYIARVEKGSRYPVIKFFPHCACVGYRVYAYICLKLILYS